MTDLAIIIKELKRPTRKEGLNCTHFAQGQGAVEALGKARIHIIKN